LCRYNKVSDEGRTAMEFLYEKMLVMADDFTITEKDTCNP
jgi:hypothetical protein